MPQPSAESTPPNLLADQHMPPAPRQARSRQKRAGILAAALTLFGEHGYDETTIEAITAAAGVAVGAFYQHFTSKRQLLLVLMDQLLRQAALLPASATGMEEQDRLTTIAHLVRQGLVIDWSYAGAWREAAVGDHELRGFNERIERWTAAQLAGLLHFLASDPAARTDVDIATFAWLLSLLFWRLAETPLDDAEAVVSVLTQMIARMLFRKLVGTLLHRPSGAVPLTLFQATSTKPIREPIILTNRTIVCHNFHFCGHILVCVTLLPSHQQQIRSILSAGNG